jgi:hypothetical protein
MPEEVTQKPIGVTSSTASVETSKSLEILLHHCRIMASLLRIPMQLSLLGLFGGLVSASPLSAVVNGATYSCNNVITRNVAVIGGGSGGTYTAVHLGDYNQSVVVIEQTDRLGGNTNTYTDPITGATIDYGVQAFHPIPTTEDYFSRFNISYYVSPYPSDSGPS